MTQIEEVRASAFTIPTDRSESDGTLGALCEFLPLPGNRVTLDAETDRPGTGVIDGDLRSFAVPNLWITDGSTLPTQGAANPRADHHGAGGTGSPT